MGVNPVVPSELDVAGIDIGFEWSLWQRQQAKEVAISFWFQLWKGSELQYRPLEKQLCSACNVLLQVEGLT